MSIHHIVSVVFVSVLKHSGMYYVLTAVPSVPGPRTPKAMLLAALNTVKDFVMGRLGDIEREEGGREDTATTDAVVHLTEGNFEDTVVRSSFLWLVEFCSPR